MGEGISKFSVGWLLGWLLFGIGLVGGIFLKSFGGPRDFSGRMFEYENQRQVFRDYRGAEKDTIYVEKESGSKDFGTLNAYLGTFEDEHDRALEKAKIEKLVDW